MAISGKPTPVAKRHPQIFHYFKALPPELRLIIWSCNLGPRVVDIICSTKSTSTSEIQQGEPTSTYRFSSSVPVNLHVCKESRSIAIVRYRLLFEEPAEHGQVILDPLRDTLYFGSSLGICFSEVRFDAFMSLARREELACVRHIAINDALISRGRRNSTSALTFERILCQARERCAAVERLTFVCEDWNPVYSSDAVLVEPKIRDRGLERDIQDMANKVEAREPQMKLPPWDVRAIAAEPDPLKYTQEVMGYRGTRRSFFRRTQLPQIERDLARRYNWAIRT
ncbi:hypothetical protein GGR53DRAFT_26275 [Hypoxylon sp. FL1150]|nr:hypothetical protein GGR53DRAFT_26275 [Hypoxylon sp. FL1150]